MISRIVWLPALLLPLCWGVAFCKTPKSPVVIIRSAPERPIIEVRDSNQFLNFEMLVRNLSGLTLRISQIELTVYDSAHELVLRKSINTDAFAPSIAVIGKQLLTSGETLDVFNPFSEFESFLPLTELQYSFCFLRESTEQQRNRNRHRLTDDCDFRTQFAISPRTYEDKNSAHSAAEREDFRLGGTRSLCSPPARAAEQFQSAVTGHYCKLEQFR
jgi:hypothetical protein